MIIKRVSVITGVETFQNIEVEKDDYEMWQNGFLPIEMAMPNLNNSERDFILSGITQVEWEEIFRRELV
jgi:hypothetical protein